MAAHTYWRIYITAELGAGGYHVALDELEFYDSSGAKLSTGGTPTASSSFASPTYDADKAFDANWSTFWHSATFPSTTPQWIKYQFGSAADVASVRLAYRSGNTNQAPKDFLIQWSDDNSSWTTAATYSGVTWATTSVGIGRCLSFPATTPAAGNYCNWRLKVLTTAGSVAPSGAEFEMHETVSGADITNSTTAEYAIWNDEFPGGFAGYKLFDNNTGSIWAGSNTPPGPPGSFVGQALNRAVKIQEIKWTARNDTFYTQSPVTGTMQASNDGVTWTDIATVTFATWTSAGQSQTVAVTAASTGGLRIHPGMEGGMRPLLSGGMNG